MWLVDEAAAAAEDYSALGDLRVQVRGRDVLYSPAQSLLCSAFARFYCWKHGEQSSEP